MEACVYTLLPALSYLSPQRHHAADQQQPHQSVYDTHQSSCGCCARPPLPRPPPLPRISARPKLRASAACLSCSRPIASGCLCSWRLVTQVLCAGQARAQEVRQGAICNILHVRLYEFCTLQVRPLLSHLTKCITCPQQPID